MAAEPAAFTNIKAIDVACTECYTKNEPWIDLGPLPVARLIATTKKSAKGESVCSKTIRPWRLWAPGFFVFGAAFA
jgi:hypothetical protein